MSHRKDVERLIKHSIIKHGAPICFWCECVVVKYPLKNRESLPDNYATVDHLYSRWNPLRQTLGEPGEKRLVLSCHKCNWTRGEKERIINGLTNNQQDVGRSPSSEVSSCIDL